jgi:hypothetical protein
MAHNEKWLKMQVLQNALVNWDKNCKILKKKRFYSVVFLKPQCTFAKWEPRHGKFRFRHPWSQYQKLGILCRQCASSMEALASYVITTMKTQVYIDA